METPLSALDILQASNLLNYFGTTDSLERIDVYPILMTKGRTKIALYGLGNVGDERLNRLFAANKVVFHKPPNFESYFRICVMHQNRDNTGRGPRNCVKDEMIPSFIDLTIWGHEHENQGPPTKRTSNGDGFNVQPGSSVATSLTEAESRSKGVALLQVKRRHFCWTPFPLKSVRPFKYVDVESDELKRRFGNPNDPDLETDIQHFIEEKVSRSLAELKDEDVPNDLLPLLRIRIDLTDYKGVTIQPHRLGMAFKDSVANPEDMILVRRRRDAKPVSKEDYPDVQEALRRGGDDDGGEFDQEGLNQIILSTFRGEGDKLSVLLEHSLTDAMQEFAIKEVKSAIRDNVDARIKAVQRKLYRDKDLNINEIDTAIAETTNEDRKLEEAKAASQSSGARIDDEDGDNVVLGDADGGAPARAGRRGRLSDSDDSDGGLSTVLRRGKPTSAAQRGRKSRGGRVAHSDDHREEEEFEDDEPPAAAPARNRKRKEQQGGGAAARKRGRAEKPAKSSSNTTTIQSLFARSQNKKAAGTKSKPRQADDMSDADSVHSGGAQRDKRISLRESDDDEEEEEDAISQASTVSADSRASGRSRRGRTATALSQASTVGVRDTPADALESDDDDDDDDAMSRGSRRSIRSRGRQAAARRRAAARKNARSTAIEDSDEDAELQAALSLSAATSVAGSEFTAQHQVSNSQVSGASSQVIDLSLADSDEDDVVQPPPRTRSTRRRRR
eukprot:INCI16321.1.p1 GENE.INCI16321.1~~INCI16321.1.p1  ORF type:complete len:730 (-),score=163.38 INCI16321.1:740-2929(-)